MVQAYPDVPAEEDREAQKVPNKANLESTQTSSPHKVESGSTGPAGRKQSQSRDATEIQRRQERPAAFRKKHKESHETKLSRKETALTQKSRAVSFRPRLNRRHASCLCPVVKVETEVAFGFTSLSRERAARSTGWDAP